MRLKYDGRGYNNTINRRNGRVLRDIWGLWEREYDRVYNATGDREIAAEMAEKVLDRFIKVVQQNN